ncbi:MAG TPA: LUD domain-containing protein [Clostridia bacterium]|nr:LUD domain-containing protein [Clostridia bacterium]
MSPDFEQLYRLFKAKAEAAAAQVYRVKTPAEAGALIAQIAQETGANQIAAAPSPLVNECLAGTSMPVPVYTENLRAHAEEAHIGLSELDMAVADIGTLQQDATDINKRLVSMLPNVHIALVRITSLVPDLKEAFVQLEQQKDRLPGYGAFITGPSRTADIERVLTIGVHGPYELRIIFIDQPGGDTNE